MYISGISYVVLCRFRGTRFQCIIQANALIFWASCIIIFFIVKVSLHSISKERSNLNSNEDKLLFRYQSNGCLARSFIIVIVRCESRIQNRTALVRSSVLVTSIICFLSFSARYINSKSSK